MVFYYHSVTLGTLWKGNGRHGKEWPLSCARIRIPPLLLQGVSGTEDGLYALLVLQNSFVLLVHYPRTRTRSPSEHPCENHPSPPLSYHAYHDLRHDGWQENASESDGNAVNWALPNGGAETDGNALNWALPNGGDDRCFDRTVRMLPAILCTAPSLGPLTISLYLSTRI